ncbi:MAG: DASS family sodium-coupled anion symporter [Candidatus Aenigmatarchaeota archaeon]|nr:MAG: DASS family sodium-coupled anion symporter [Candidatus Aenigmarchaeota archaeon]
MSIFSRILKKPVKAIPLVILFLIYVFVIVFDAVPPGLSYQGFTVIMIFFATIYLWATEILPLAVSAFLAILMLAASGSVSVVDSLYGFGSSVVFLIIIGFFLAVGLRKSGLDNRIAYGLLRRSHSENALLISIIVITGFLSMLISNTATTLLMVPIAIHIMHQVKLNNEALLLGIAYAANIGGVGILIGTPPNIIGAEALGWNFYDWMVASLPIALIMLVLLYVSFMIYFRPKHERIKKHLIEDLGPMKRKEKITASVIILTLILWITSPIHNIPTIAVGLIGGLLMFLFVYDWRYFEKKTHWGTIILIAGAVSLGWALQQTGAVEWIATGYLNMTGLTSPALIAFSFVILCLFITQFIQNTATAAMFVPVLVGLSQTLGIPTEILILPVVWIVSMTFLMPPGTAPNAIVHGIGKIKTKEMFRAGIIPTIFALCLIFLYIMFVF